MSETKKHVFHKKGFLVLERKDDEGIKIGDDIEIVLKNSKDGIAYLAIKAPGKKVLRSEIVKNKPRIENGSKNK